MNKSFSALWLDSKTVFEKKKKLKKYPQKLKLPQRSWSLLTFGGTMARCSPEARYDDSDCFTVFSSKNEEAHHSPFLKEKSLF